MNWLVYKSEGISPLKAHLAQYDSDANKVSEILFDRLKTKDEERYSDYSDRKARGQLPSAPASQRDLKHSSSQYSKSGGLSYSEWLKLKDSEKRLKKKLIVQAQNEVKEELLLVVKQENEKYQERVKAMDDWLMRKKLEEAEKSAHLRELDRRDEIERKLREEHHTDSYKDWMKVQALKKRQSAALRHH